jgi:hypothetical protein
MANTGSGVVVVEKQGKPSTVGSSKTSRQPARASTRPELTVSQALEIVQSSVVNLSKVGISYEIVQLKGNRIGIVISEVQVTDDGRLIRVSLGGEDVKTEEE